jgi:hypothetical protein
MSFFDLAKDALKEIPMADVMRARLELAFDQSTLQEKQISTLREENAELKAELKIAARDIEKKTEELAALREAHREAVRIHKGVEFRKGSRTGDAWMSFCPKCHLTLEIPMSGGDSVACADINCGWVSQRMAQEVWDYKTALK